MPLTKSCSQGVALVQLPSVPLPWKAGDAVALLEAEVEGDGERARG